MAVAAADLGRPDPAGLYTRFVAWALPPAQACRVCGRPSHGVLPGLPPRLNPCDRLHDDPPGTRTAGRDGDRR
jgi:hypothetical protein